MQNPQRGIRHYFHLRIFWVATLVLFLLASTVVLVAAGSLKQAAGDGQAIFKQKCAACHTIGGGKLVGPDLEGVTARRSQDWLKSWMLAPDKLIAQKDPTAVQLLQESNNMPMPNLGLSEAEVQSLLAYLENPASAGQTQTPQQPAASLQAGDPVRGRSIFTGRQSLLNGAPACISCHSVAGVGALSGGSLGPELTHVIQRYGGQAGMASTLASLPFPTMQGAFATRPLSPNEQADLLAYFTQVDQQTSGQPAPLSPWLFIGVGLVGAAVLFAFLLFYWPRQRQSLSHVLRSTR